MLESDASRAELRLFALEVVHFLERLARTRRAGSITGVVEEARRVVAELVRDPARDFLLRFRPTFSS